MVTRIRQLLEYKQLTPTQFADFIGVGRPVVSHILSERNKPSLEVAQRIGSAFPDISLAWLMFGTGDMLATAAASPGAASPVAITAPEATPSNELAAPEPTSEPLPVAAAAMPPAEAEFLVPTGATPEAATPALPLSAEIPPAAGSARPLQALPRPFSAPQSVPSVAVAPATAAPTSAPGLNHDHSPELAVAPTAPQPFRAARSVPAPAVSSQEATRPAVLPAASPQPAAEPTAAVPAPPTLAAATTLPARPDLEAAMLPFLSDSGKAIRRIVIFYRDGSFADYQPE